jgi:hypothetical protein
MVERAKIAAMTAMQAAMGATETHPLLTIVAAIASSIISLMQSAQEVASTLMALITSITGVVLAYMALRGAFKKKE